MLNAVEVLVFKMTVSNKVTFANIKTIFSYYKGGYFPSQQKLEKNADVKKKII